MVKIEKTYYHLDVTFDNTLGKEQEEAGYRYDYFNLDDKKVFRDHEPLLASAPVCGDGDHFYYREKKLSFTKLEEVSKRALQAAKKKKPLVFHWRGGSLNRETGEEILRLLSEAGKEKQRSIRVGINVSQAVFQAIYTETFTVENMQESVVFEQANEGETD